MNDLEEIKRKILLDKYKYISFDVFDTVIIRPFWNPTDLFYLLDAEFERYIDSAIGFYRLRVDGETGARSVNKEKYPARQDITIDEIYLYIEKTYALPSKLCQHMKQFEIELELKFLTARESVKKLYNLALAYDKKIIFITDMYMRESFIHSALEQNGYVKFEKLFVSSEERLLKKSGDMYTCVLNDLRVSGSEVLHIGDDLKSDIDMAKSHGIDACYIPKTVERFKHLCGVKENDFKIKMPLLACSTVMDYRQVESSMGFRCMLAIIANKYFDKPFRDFSAQSDFNEDPYFIGYYAVGMHLIGINHWIEEKVSNKNYRHIWFASRDGWLIMCAYNILRSIHPNLPEAKYLYLSRESTLSIQINNELDFYDLPIEYWKYSPETLFDLLKFCCKEIDKTKIVDFLKKENITYAAKFRNVIEYHKFVKVFLEKYYSKEKHKEAKEIVYKYFSKISDNDIIFDMGYSGRIYYALSNILKRKIDALFIYSDAVKCQSMCRKGNFSIQTLYDYTPSMPGMLREFFLSSHQPSCIGYKLNNNQEVIPEFINANREDGNKIPDVVHNGALEFVNDFYGIFGSYLNYIFFKATEVSLPFEGMLENISEADRLVFENSFSEDMIYGRNPNMNIARFWKNKLNEKMGVFSLKDINRKDIK